MKLFLKRVLVSFIFSFVLFGILGLVVDIIKMNWSIGLNIILVILFIVAKMVEYANLEVSSNIKRKIYTMDLLIWPVISFILGSCFSLLDDSFMFQGIYYGILFLILIIVNCVVTGIYILVNTLKRKN